MLKNRKVSAVELTENFLRTIEKKDKEIHAFLTVSGESAIEDAKKIDQKIAAGEDIGALGGIQFSIKDSILVKDIRCTAASKVLENYVAPYDATAVRKIKEAGGIIIGKANLDEFAMGASTENSAFGPTKNPLDTERVPGGSSGGSLASLAADECIGSLGTDTGGSIRHPASFTGMVALKPTYGAVSRHGLMAMSSSLDVIGPAAKNVDDVKTIFDVIKGKDKLDATSIESKDLSSVPEVSSLKIGIPKEYFGEGMDERVEACVKEIIEKLKPMVAEVKEVSLPHTSSAIPVYYILMPAEVSANLSRYDGIRFGESNTKKSESLLDNYLSTRRDYLGSEVKRRVMLGAYVLAEGHYDSFYQKAQKVGWLIKEDFNNVFKEADLLITPTTTTTAFKFGERTKDPIQMYLSDLLTAATNIAGIPAMSVPCGMVDGLPVGLQIIGPWLQEKNIFELGKVIEKIQS